MANVGQLYEDKNKTKPFYPKSLTKAIYTENGIALFQLLQPTKITISNSEWNSATLNNLNCYKYSKNISGITEYNTPLIYLEYTNASLAQNEYNNYGYIFDCYSRNNQLDIYAVNKPNITLNLLVKWC